MPISFRKIKKSVHGDSVYLNHLGLTNADIPVIVKFLNENSYISCLDVRSNHIGHEGAIALALGAPTLKMINIEYNSIGDEGLAALAANKNLIYLNAGGGNLLHSAGVAALKDNTNVKHLNISGSWVYNEGAIALAANKTLINLDMSQCAIDGEGVEALARNKSLRRLRLYSTKLEKRGIIALAENTTLVSLNIPYCSITVEEMAILATNQTLKYLNVNGIDLSDNRIAMILNHLRLASLRMNHCNIGDNGAKYLAENSQLTTLYLSGNLITNEGAQHFLKNKNLTKLNLKKNNIDQSLVIQIEEHIFSNNPPIVKLGALTSQLISNIQGHSETKLPNMRSRRRHSENGKKVQMLRALKNWLDNSNFEKSDEKVAIGLALLQSLTAIKRYPGVFCSAQGPHSLREFRFLLSQSKYQSLSQLINNDYRFTSQELSSIKDENSIEQVISNSVAKYQSLRGLMDSDTLVKR